MEEAPPKPSVRLCGAVTLLLTPISLSLHPQRCIINNTHRLVELCVAKLSQDWFPLLELLAMATNPHCKFHIYNGTRPSETIPAGATLADDELFARSPDPRSPKVGPNSPSLTQDSSLDKVHPSFQHE